MKNKTILLFSRDPGGANTVVPLVPALREKGYSVKLFGKDMALKKYSNAGLEGVDISTLLNKVNPAEVESFLCAEKADFLITGTSASDPVEKYLWKAAEKLNVPSFAILDQ